MSEITFKLDKLIMASIENKNVNHEPDSSKEQQRNTPEKSMPFSD